MKIITGISNYRIRFQEQKSFIKSLSFNCLIKGNTGNDYFYYFSGNLSPISNETSQQTAFIYFRGDNMHCHIDYGGFICLRCNAIRHFVPKCLMLPRKHSCRDSSAYHIFRRSQHLASRYGVRGQLT